MQKQNGLSDFDARSDIVLTTREVHAVYENFYRSVLPSLDSGQLRDLRSRIDERLPNDRISTVYDTTYDIRVEVEGLISAVRAMQMTVMDNGVLRSGITTKEMKEVVTSTTTLLSLLVKTHEKFMGFDRQRALELATVEVLRELSGEKGEEIVGRFAEMMEARLDR